MSLSSSVMHGPREMWMKSIFNEDCFAPLHTRHAPFGGCRCTWFLGWRSGMVGCISLYDMVIRGALMLEFSASLSLNFLLLLWGLPVYPSSLFSSICFEVFWVRLVLNFAIFDYSYESLWSKKKGFLSLLFFFFFPPLKMSSQSRENCLELNVLNKGPLAPMAKILKCS